MILKSLFSHSTRCTICWVTDRWPPTATSLHTRGSLSRQSVTPRPDLQPSDFQRVHFFVNFTRFPWIIRILRVFFQILFQLFLTRCFFRFFLLRFTRFNLEFFVITLFFIRWIVLLTLRKSDKNIVQRGLTQRIVHDSVTLSVVLYDAEHVRQFQSFGWELILHGVRVLFF